MSFRNKITRYLILPTSDFFTGFSISKYLTFLNKSQFWTREELENHQNNRLRLLINHAYTHVPFYYELFQDLRLKPDDIQDKNDLSKLPIITKDELKKSKGKHFAKNLRKNEAIYMSSSGSTGEPFQFFTTKESESFLKASAIRGWNWMGYRLGDSYVKISMNPRNSILKRIQDLMNNSLFVSSKQLTSKEFKRIAEDIKNRNPKFIRCYPDPLLFLSQQIQKNDSKYKVSRLVGINTTGSTLKEETRKVIEDVFGVKVYDSYSCEGGAIFFECLNGKYHPTEEYAIQEFIDDDFTKSHPEKPKRHITTDLYNYASPFIRYDTQDYVVMGEKELCECGRHFLNVEKILGRDSDILTTPSGKFLIVENFVAYFEWVSEVDQIQIVQDEIDSITIYLVVNESFSDRILHDIKRYWRDYIGPDVKLIVEVVKTIELTASGKRRTVIRNPNIKIVDR